MIKRIKRFCSSDVELRTETYWEGGKEKIDGFYFLSKKPFSNAYQYCGTISLRDTYPILSLISESIKQKKKGMLLAIRDGMAHEKIIIWKGSLPKAEKLMLDMIKEIQKQY
ncbi:hypothetical protein SP3_00035 [Bacillus phage fHSPT3]